MNYIGIVLLSLLNTQKHNAMNYKKLFSHLDLELPNKIDSKVDWINRGGCGVFAYILAEELNKLGIKAKVAWLTSYDTSIKRKRVFKKLLRTNNNNVSLSELNANYISCAHCMVVVKGRFIDATGVYNGHQDTEWSERGLLKMLTWEELKPIAENSDGWNSSFDRKQIPMVKRNIKKVVKSLVV